MKDLIRFDIKAKFFGYHGVNKEEKETGQEFGVSLSYFIKAKNFDDNLSKTIDYQSVVADVEKFFTKNRYNLMEQLVQDMLRYLLKSYREIEKVAVSVSKYNPPVGAQVDSITTRFTLQR